MRLVNISSSSLPQDLQHQEVPSLFPPLLQGQCSSESTPTHRRSHWLFSEIPGSLLTMNLLLASSQRVCQMSGSGTSMSEYAHSAPMSIETRSLLSRPPQTPREDAHQHLKNSLTTYNLLTKKIRIKCIVRTKRATTSGSLLEAYL